MRPQNEQLGNAAGRHREEWLAKTLEGALLGRFIRADNNTRGVGKLVSTDGTDATVEYFNSPTADPIIAMIPVASLRYVEIGPQTRIYWLDREAGFWRVGRVLDGEGDRFVVRFPNGDERLLPTQELYIRWNRPITDPTPYLAHWINETPLFAGTPAAALCGRSWSNVRPARACRRFFRR